MYLHNKVRFHRREWLILVSAQRIRIVPRSDLIAYMPSDYSPGSTLDASLKGLGARSFIVGLLADPACVLISASRDLLHRASRWQYGPHWSSFCRREAYGTALRRRQNDDALPLPFGLASTETLATDVDDLIDSGIPISILFDDSPAFFSPEKNLPQLVAF